MLAHFQNIFDGLQRKEQIAQLIRFGETIQKDFFGEALSCWSHKSKRWENEMKN